VEGKEGRTDTTGVCMMRYHRVLPVVSYNGVERCREIERVKREKER
jgi:hypothetical protein